MVEGFVGEDKDFVVDLRAGRYGKNIISRFLYGRIMISILSRFFRYSCWFRLFYKSQHIQSHSLAYQHMVGFYLVPGPQNDFILINELLNCKNYM